MSLSDILFFAKSMGLLLDYNIPLPTHKICKNITNTTNLEANIDMTRNMDIPIFLMDYQGRQTALDTEESR
jgi:hypothetical protein